ncbi:helix-turn-helix domain-containing protein [Companilactobacillus huachuanensis]|uniref:Helix-turn-helix domain-containing protein n=1 Tax=Companilactobacillus huachuanensis TaxID=2559914 RepID=A0ABW1RH72_9LACO|nr:helix-turn-helix transcriptional regulator [Companilactobacillus huachuanensis]
MFLGSVIYDKRRSLNLTQGNLAKGICNQNTISKMEKHSMTPQIEVLVQICQRLNLTLNDVFSDFSGDIEQEKVFVLDDIEESILLKDTFRIDDKLSLVENDISPKDRVQFNFVKGLLEFFRSDFEISTFNLDKVLQGTKLDNDDIYTLMSYLVKGMICLEQKHLDMVAYYCKTISDALQENLNIANANVIEVLFLCKSLGNMYTEINQPDFSIEVSKRAIEYANERHSSYFIDELNYNIALAFKYQSDQVEEYEKYKNIAYYSAISLNHPDFQKLIENDNVK